MYTHVLQTHRRANRRRRCQKALQHSAADGSRWHPGAQPGREGVLVRVRMCSGVRLLACVCVCMSTCMHACVCACVWLCAWFIGT